MSPTILLTGATSGIGHQTALDLAARGARLLVHGRDRYRLRELQVELRRHAPDAPEALAFEADLSSLRSVRALGQQVRQTVDHLDVLLLNAGVYDRERALTPDGYERSIAVNHLAPFLLSRELLPLLKQTAEQRGEARVVVVASVAHHRGRMHWEDLMLEQAWEAPGSPMPGYTAYAQSKLANILFANALARRLQGSAVTSNSLHPGVINTKLLREGFQVEGSSLDEGSKTSLHLALSPALRGVSGRYFSDQREAPMSAAARDEATQERFWQISEALIAQALE